MTDIMAALGLAQMKRYPELLQRRREIIERYNKAFSDYPVTFLNHYTADASSSGHLYLLRLNGKNREELNAIIEQMAEMEIATNVHYKPLPLLSAYKNLGFKNEDYPNANDLYENAISLPLHTKLTDEQIDYVVESLGKCLGIR